MRRQVRGLHQGSENIQDGISMLQTAEGALVEVHDMLQRMNELAVKAVRKSLSLHLKQTLQRTALREWTMFRQGHIIISF